MIKYRVNACGLKGPPCIYPYMFIYNMKKNCIIFRIEYLEVTGKKPSIDISKICENKQAAFEGVPPLELAIE